MLAYRREAPIGEPLYIIAIWTFFAKIGISSQMLYIFNTSKDPFTSSRTKTLKVQAALICNHSKTGILNDHGEDHRSSAMRQLSLYCYIFCNNWVIVTSIIPESAAHMFSIRSKSTCQNTQFFQRFVMDVNDRLSFKPARSQPFRCPISDSLSDGSRSLVKTRLAMKLFRTALWISPFIFVRILDRHDDRYDSISFFHRFLARVRLIAVHSLDVQTNDGISSCFSLSSSSFQHLFARWDGIQEVTFAPS
jgi:hypothetical protein